MTEAQSIPASHRTGRELLPDIPVSWVHSIDDGAPRTLQAALDWWRSNPASELLLVIGPFGSGKTHGLQQFAAKSEGRVLLYGYADLDSINHTSGEHDSGRILIIDNFDAITALGPSQRDEPDLRDLQPLQGSGRLIAATRRGLHGSPSELAAQILSGQRLERLRFPGARAIHLQAWSIEALRAFHQDQTARDERWLRVLAHLERNSEIETEWLRRPLPFLMLLRLASVPDALNKHFTPATLYSDYFDIALSADYDQKHSELPSQVKVEILTHLAFDIFTGAQSDMDSKGGLTLNRDRVTQRAMEFAMQARLMSSRGGGDRDWTNDFIHTNHLFGRAAPGRFSVLGQERYEFLHPTYYEYFVARAICARVEAGHALGLDVERFSAASIDSMAFAFVKEIGGLSIREAARNIVSRPRLGPMDRLVLFYFLEDEIDFADLIMNAPLDYLRELEHLHESASSFFIKKMVRYQLVVAGRYDAYLYVSEVKSLEDPIGVRAEIRLHSAEVDLTERLLARLSNPSLVNARPITVYRLGQMGSAAAIEPLRLLARRDSGRLGELARTAAEDIEARLTS